MQDATTVYPPITPAWTNLAVTSEIDKLDLSGMSSDVHRYDSASPRSDRSTIDADRLSPVSSTSASSSSSTLPPKKRYMQTMLANDSNKENDDHLDVPIYNSAGKVQKHSCRRCSFVTTSKSNYWSHLRTHIRPEKLLECAKCPFVTDSKRHFECHARLHLNYKPFKCQQCEYSGASKSMLDSHLKSHSTWQPYRCRECKFASKFVSRLRQHLDRRGHEEGLMLNENGSLNLENVIVSARREAAMKNTGRVSATPVQVELRDGKMVSVVLPTASFYYEPMYAGYAMPSAATQVVLEVHEEPKNNTAPVNYKQRLPALPSLPNREVAEISLPLDLSKKNEAKGSSVAASAFDCSIEDGQDVQQQIQHLRANLDNMHKRLWNFEQKYMYTSA